MTEIIKAYDDVGISSGRRHYEVRRSNQGWHWYEELADLRPDNLLTNF